MSEPGWVSVKLDGVPTSLRKCIAEAAPDQEPGEPSVARLKEAAERLLAETIAEGDAADPAYLLAADALITLACEALSEFDPSGLADIR